ncbi:HAD family hydrolase [Promicromonospora sp. NPDC060271]|uniref:HAD family hydrolase n=1 Tax=Promicromonospora sp. NPDC060271 TaxID=3347089 RepID=UPI00365507AE
MSSATPQRTTGHMDVTRPALVACGIDGTLVRTGCPVSRAVHAAAAEVRAAGHHIVLATGRSLVGALPVALQLGLHDAWIVASNGAVTARLLDGHYEIVDQHPLDAEAAIQVAIRMAPGARLAAEIVGAGYRVNTPFPDGRLNGTQYRIGRIEGVWRYGTTRLILLDPAAHRLVPDLRALGLTAIATGADWVDVTAPGISKATALEKIRTRLDVQDCDTVAIGDGENDLEMLSWATRGIAMGHAPAHVRAVADTVTGTIDDDGAATALLSMLD